MTEGGDGLRPPGAPPLLRTVGLTKRFGGLEAVRSVDLHLARGEIHGVIGPNGAGKTTLAHMLSGRIRPTAGKVLFEGRDITNVPAHARAAMGIVYAFQAPSLYRTLTVFDNVAIAVQRRLARGALAHLSMDHTVLTRRVNSALALVGLEAWSDLRAGALPHGRQRLLEVVMALALEPEVLILDEPSQGLAPEETTAVTALLEALSAHATILLIEHNIPLVLAHCDRITVLDRGAIIAEGTPQEIEANADVQRVYLGGG
jgi:branched-chain amino acid transport system ATP-binding protein